jgi:hypothetical protein
MASVVNTRTYFQLQSKLVKKAYTNSAPMKALRYPSVFNDYKGDYERAFFQYLSLIGFGTLAVKGEGEVPAVDVSKEGILSYYAYTSYALRYIVTKEMIREDAKSVIPKLPGLLKYSSDQTKEYLFWNVFNYAFNGSVLLANGQPLVSSSIPILGTSVVPGQTTFSNNLGSVPLTVETLEQAQILFSTIPDDRGLLSYRTPQKLIYPPAMHQVAMEVLASGYYPTTNENRINAVAGAVTPMPIEYLTAAPNGPFPWFVLAGQGEPGTDSHTVFADVKWDEQDAYYDEPTQSMIHSTEFRAVWGAVEQRGVVGSSGG